MPETTEAVATDELERIWRANNAHEAIKLSRANDEDPSSDDLDSFLANIDAFKTVREVISESLGVEDNNDTAHDTIYDTLAESSPGDTLDSLALRSLVKIKDRELIDRTQHQIFNPDVKENEDTETPLTQNITPEPIQEAEEWTSKDDYQLVTMHRTGNEQASAHLIERHSGIIWRLANKMAPSGRYAGIDASDLFQEGALALLHAADLADTERSTKFLTYAHQHIRSAMHAYILDNRSTVRTPRNVGEDLNRIRRENTERSLHQRPLLTDNEIEKMFNLTGMGLSSALKSVAQYRQAELLTYWMGSIDSGFAPSRDSSPGNDYIIDAREGITNLNTSEAKPADDLAIRMEVRSTILSALETLDDRSRQVLRLRFGIDNDEPMTLEQVAKEFGVDRARIRQIESKALAKMRHPDLRKYFDRLLNED